MVIEDLAEDDVLPIEPAGDNCGDEELGAVARWIVSYEAFMKQQMAYVLGPALAMERSPGLVCFLAKFSSANFSP